MTEAAWVQAFATIVLIIVTGWYVLHTSRIAEHTKAAATAARESAEAAKQSAQASRDLVELEQQRLALAEREREEDKRHLARQLRAELQRFLVFWPQVQDTAKESRSQALRAEAVATLAVGRSRSAVFDVERHRLHLLGQELAAEVTGCYALLKQALDGLLNAQGLAHRQRSAETRGSAANIGTSAWQAFTSAVRDGEAAVIAAKQLLSKLDAVAKGE
jgi:hypothetical protein